MSDVIAEVNKILSEPRNRVVFVPNDDSGTWINVFLNGLRVGYVYFCQSDSGWSVTLVKTWGAPRDVFSVVYLEKADAIARIESELSR